MNPRASHYSAPALHELRRAGLMEELSAKGFWPDGVSWRKMDGTRITGIHNDHLLPENKMVCLPLDRFIPLIMSHLERQPSASVHFKHKVVRIGQDKDKAWIDVEAPEGEKRLFAPYIVGCDGATSKVRRELFGDSFPGRTWDEQIVATNVRRILWFLSVPSTCYSANLLLRSTTRDWQSTTGKTQTSFLTQKNITWWPRFKPTVSYASPMARPRASHESNISSDSLQSLSHFCQDTPSPTSTRL